MCGLGRSVVPACAHDLHVFVSELIQAIDRSIPHLKGGS